MPNITFQLFKIKFQKNTVNPWVKTIFKEEKQNEYQKKIRDKVHTSNIMHLKPYSESTEAICEVDYTCTVLLSKHIPTTITFCKSCKEGYKLSMMMTYYT